MTTDKNRQTTIINALADLERVAKELKECVEEDVLCGLNTSESDLQIDLQKTFDRFLHAMGYWYDQRRY